MERVQGRMAEGQQSRTERQEGRKAGRQRGKDGRPNRGERTEGRTEGKGRRAEQRGKDGRPKGKGRKGERRRETDERQEGLSNGLRPSISGLVVVRRSARL